MKISKKRINNVSNYLSDLKENQDFYIGIYSNSKIKEKLKKDFECLDSKAHIYMPIPILGINSERNIMGELIPDKTKPKIIDYKARTYRLKDWQGNWHEGIAEDEYRRYPRNYIEPKNFSFKLITKEETDLLIINKNFRNNEKEYNDIKFCINLFLELFSEVETFKLENNMIKLNPIISTVNWTIIPKGEKVFEAHKDKKYYHKISPSSMKLMEERFDFIEQFNPDREFQGKAGYTGYIVFCFDQKNIYLLDSILYGNATYVFSDNWENVSKLTKKEIISNHFQKSRIVHNKNWKQYITKELKNDLYNLQK
ncbi:MAG: hypothetical protein M3Z87_18920 [Lactobacillus sp.]|nr:hypothetical protein [Lactobacillus sp.]